MISSGGYGTINLVQRLKDKKIFVIKVTSIKNRKAKEI